MAEAAAKQEKQKNHKTAAYIPGHPAPFESGQGMAGVLRGIVIKKEPCGNFSPRRGSF